MIVFGPFNHRHCAAVSLKFAVKKPKPETCQTHKSYRVDGVEGGEQNEK